MPDAWKEPTDESDYDLIALTLDRMEAAAGAGQYRQAEQARLEAYAFFEFGPERRLKSFDPGLALDVEGLIWFGARGTAGPREADRRPRAAPRDPRDARSRSTTSSPTPPRRSATARAGDRRHQLGDHRLPRGPRGGAHPRRDHRVVRRRRAGGMRRPVLVGARARPAGLDRSPGCSPRRCCTSLERYGEKLEAVVGLVAIAVLLLITNWFFHRVYWSEWIGRFHRRRKQLSESTAPGFISAQVLGLALLGLTSVYREGFETVLFLQSLRAQRRHRDRARGRRRSGSR